MTISKSSARTLPLPAAPIPMEDPSMSPSSSPSPPDPLAAVASFLRHHVSRLSSEISSRVDQLVRHFVLAAASPRLSLLPFAAASQGKHSFDVALSAGYVAKTLAGTSVYTVSNSNNEFVFISDPSNFQSLGILCSGKRTLKPSSPRLSCGSPFWAGEQKLYPSLSSLDQLLSVDISQGFDGVPVFQSDILIVKKKNKRYCPIYFQKEDIERELLKAPKASRGSGLCQNIMVGSSEDKLKRMEMNDENSGWDDLIFIPPGKSYTQHISEVAIWQA